MSTATMQRPLDGEASILFRQPLAPIRSMDARRSIDDLKLVFSSSYTSLSAARSSSDNDDERHSLYQRRKYSVPALTISRLPHGRRRSRNSPVISASHTLNRSYHGSQRRTSLPALHFHETKVATLHLETPLPNGDAIPDDIYRQLRTYTFGSPDSQRATHEDQYLNEDEDERLRDSRAKRRNTNNGLSKDSLLTTPSIRSQSSLSSFSSDGIVVGELQTDNQSEPDWNTVMNDLASSRTPTRPSSSLDSASIRSEPRRPSLASQPILRRQSRSANELKADIDQVDIARTPTQVSFRSTSQQPMFDWSKTNASSSGTGPSDQAYTGFDLPFIFNNQARTPSAVPKSSNHVKGNGLGSTSFQPLSFDSPSMISLTGVVQSTPLKGQVPSGNIFSRLKAKVKHISPPHEDTFMKHIMDPEWTFRRMSQVEYSSRIRDHEGGHKLVESPEGWSCQPIGEFIVYKMWVPNHSIPAPSANVKPPQCNQLRIYRLMEPPSTGSTPLVIVHRHSQVHGFSIYRYASQATTDAILLAPKNVLRQYTRTRSTRSLRTHGLIEDVRPSLVPRQSDRHNSEGTNGPSTVIGGLDRPSAFTNRTTLFNPSDQQMLLSPEPSRPPTASSMGTDRSLSVITDTSKTLEYPRVISSSEYILSSESSSPRSPRFSRSHAEAFAMITDYIPTTASTHPHVLHGQKSPFGWLKALSSKPSLHKEPSSPATDEEEEVKKGDFVGPWVKIAPRADRVEAERQVKQVSESFECVGLIPPHEKKKKRRINNNPAVEECAALEKISSDSMCMLLPLWSEQIETPLSSHASLSGRSAKSEHSSISKPTIPLEDRKYLLVSYVPLEEEVSNKRRRSPGENTSPHPSYTQAFRATGEILTYRDLRSSGLRLPQRGLCVNGVNAMPLSQEQKPHVLAVSPNKQDGVMIDHEALEAFGFVESLPEGARLSNMGKAVAEMIWCGCITLVTFMS